MTVLYSFICAIFLLMVNNVCAQKPTRKPKADISTDGPVYVAASHITTTNDGPNVSPTLAPLSVAQEQALLRDLAKLPTFPAYPYSGCDDRAHALYLLLPQWQPHLAKVWLFSGAVLSPAFAGGIRYGRAGVDSTSWDYHVALTYRRAAGSQLFVVDVALASSPQPITITKWLITFRIPPASIWTLLPGELYSFNRTESCNYSKFRQFFNGNLFAYTGGARASNRIPTNLARDAVGALVLQRNDCPEIAALLKKPGELLSYLQQATSNSSTRCDQVYLTTYQQALAAWKQHLQE